MEFTLAYAQQQDRLDKIAYAKDKFYFPVVNNKPVIYFTGNSLGLQPKTTQDYVLNELEDWATHGVEGHFHARNPWMPYHEQFAKPLAALVGANENEVVCMNQLTTNLHLLLVSFYNPTPTRFKIICEAKAFPSDQYMLQSQVQFHGYNTSDAIIEVAPRAGETCIRHEDIIEKIKQHGNTLALVFIGGVNYFTGQVFDMQTITKAAHSVGALAGFDLAHGIGNIKIELHTWQVDFASWCSYKYLNSGPGGVSGIYIQEKHFSNKSIKRFAGWWGHDKETRFKMNDTFVPMPSAEAWQLSNAPILSMAAHKAALDIFMEVGLENLFKKRDDITAYLIFIIDEVKKSSGINLEIITPRELGQRGSQVSVVAHGQGKALYEKLMQLGVIVDWREPNVIRMAPVPMYTSYEDIYNFGEILKNCLEEKGA